MMREKNTLNLESNVESGPRCDIGQIPALAPAVVSSSGIEAD